MDVQVRVLCAQVAGDVWPMIVNGCFIMKIPSTPRVCKPVMTPSHKLASSAPSLKYIAAACQAYTQDNIHRSIFDLALAAALDVQRMGHRFELVLLRCPSCTMSINRSTLFR